MIIVGTGSREWKRRDIILRVLRAWHEPGAELVVGDADGADAIMREIWSRYVGPPNVFHARWGVFGKRAGHLRNELMIQRALAAVARGEEVVVTSFMLRPSTPGTLDCIAQARDAGLFLSEHLL